MTGDPIAATTVAIGAMTAATTEACAGRTANTPETRDARAADPCLRPAPTPRAHRRFPHQRRLHQSAGARRDRLASSVSPSASKPGVVARPAKAAQLLSAVDVPSNVTTAILGSRVSSLRCDAVGRQACERLCVAPLRGVGSSEGGQSHRRSCRYQRSARWSSGSRLSASGWPWPSGRRVERVAMGLASSAASSAAWSASRSPARRVRRGRSRGRSPQLLTDSPIARGCS